jgi:hypothetical protein
MFRLPFMAVAGVSLLFVALSVPVWVHLTGGRPLAVTASGFIAVTGMSLFVYWLHACYKPSNTHSRGGPASASSGSTSDCASTAATTSAPPPAAAPSAVRRRDEGVVIRPPRGWPSPRRHARSLTRDIMPTHPPAEQA